MSIPSCFAFLVLPMKLAMILFSIWQGWTRAGIAWVWTSLHDSTRRPRFIAKYVSSLQQNVLHLRGDKGMKCYEWRRHQDSWGVLFNHSIYHKVWEILAMISILILTSCNMKRCNLHCLHRVEISWFLFDSKNSPSRPLNRPHKVIYEGNRFDKTIRHLSVENQIG